MNDYTVTISLTDEQLEQLVALKNWVNQFIGGEVTAESLLSDLMMTGNLRLIGADGIVLYTDEKETGGESA